MDFITWMVEELNELGSNISKVTKCIDEELPVSLGAPGVPGNRPKFLHLRTEGVCGGSASQYRCIQIDFPRNDENRYRRVEHLHEGSNQFEVR
jgi:hypothetical protein